MRLPVLTAVTDAALEADLVATLEAQDLGLIVVRRCVDLPDLLAAAALGTARAAVLSADLRRLDRDALVRLAAAGLAVVGLVPADDEAAERRLRQLGVDVVLAWDVGPAAISAAVLAAVRAGPGVSRGVIDRSLGDPRSALSDLPDLPDPSDEPGVLPLEPASGRLVAVWGPTGAPGRTTVAVTVAAELAAAGLSTLLVDADVFGGVVAQVLGLLDESPGLVAAARQSGQGLLDLPGLAALAPEAATRLRVLTGMARADRWPELRPADVEAVLALARRLARVVVVDCGFSLEQDEEIAFDTMAPRRNGVTLEVLAGADVVLAVGRADPVGLQRLVRGLADLREAVPDVTPRVVVTRVRRGAVPGDPRHEVTAALARYAGVRDPVLVSDDPAALDLALARGRTLTEVAPGSPARLALRDLAHDLAGLAPRRSRRRLRRSA